MGEVKEGEGFSYTYIGTQLCIDVDVDTKTQPSKESGRTFKQLCTGAGQKQHTPNKIIRHYRVTNCQNCHDSFLFL